MAAVKLSIRLDLPGGTRFGPGKADLLTMIDAAGSVSGAARELKMSYPRALRLVEGMNTQFRGPLVETFQGGAKRGGARLTDLGRDVLQTYRTVQHAAAMAGTDELKALAKLTQL